MSNTALYADDNCTFTVKRSQDIPQQNAKDLLIKTRYSGVNPADTKHANYLGIFPSVLGYDFCGEVITAPATSAYQAGDLVAGYTPTGVGKRPEYGAHQSYIVCPENMLFPVPAHLPSSHAASLSVVVMTAADALYNIFEFPLPSTASITPPSTGPLLIWGASSSVGICAVQLAKASGISPIFVTASKERHGLLRELGATHCFDYKSPTVVADIRTAVQNAKSGPLRYGFDAVGSHQNRGSAQLVADCTDEDACLVSVVVQSDPRFKMPLATSNTDVVFHPRGLPQPITIPARPVEHKRAWEVLQWVVQNYQDTFRIPSVEVFEGSAEEALVKVTEVGDSGRGFGKLVLKHPLL